MKKLVNGIMVDMTADEITARQAEEIAWANGAADRNLVELREKRDRLLAETDYQALSDNTMSAAMTTYRQALRDITDTYSSLDDVVWPEKP